MKVAARDAHAVEHLHKKVNPPVLCGNVRSTNVFLERNFEPKAADYGLVNLESSSGSNVHKWVVGSVGCAPESEHTSVFKVI
ncbi:putative non-specific serine/threonine protein kinase [Helianthus annuus]|nr:putative non-specific serine/threonine protein kinase [Helianthus annuus]